MNNWTFGQLTTDQLAHEAAVSDNMLAIACIETYEKELEEVQDEALEFKTSLVEFHKDALEEVLDEEERDALKPTSDYISNVIECHGNQGALHTVEYIREYLKEACSNTAFDGIDEQDITNLSEHQLDELRDAIWNEEGYDVQVKHAMGSSALYEIGTIDLGEEPVELLEHPYIEALPMALRVEVMEALTGTKDGTVHYHDRVYDYIALTLNVEWMNNWVQDNLEMLDELT
tara:strand:+ start:40845 stop:41537 length:693 start_codon:yes stop_codon:yes gene_type:complete